MLLKQLMSFVPTQADISSVGINSGVQLLTALLQLHVQRCIQCMLL
jgi:hypothetical protein